MENSGTRTQLENLEKRRNSSQAWWLTLIMLATQEAEAGGYQFSGQPSQR
jgi:hypothetical protein